MWQSLGRLLRLSLRADRPQRSNSKPAALGKEIEVVPHVPDLVPNNDSPAVAAVPHLFQADSLVVCLQRLQEGSCAFQITARELTNRKVHSRSVWKEGEATQRSNPKRTAVGNAAEVLAHVADIVSDEEAPAVEAAYELIQAGSLEIRLQRVYEGSCAFYVAMGELTNREVQSVSVRSADQEGRAGGGSPGLDGQT
jgi:hypothetical protein